METNDTVVIKYSTNVAEYEQEVQEIIRLTELLESKLKSLNVKVEVTQFEPSK